MQAHQTGASADRLEHLAVSNVLAPALVKLYAQACSRARQTPRRKAPAQGEQPTPWSQVEEHAAASGVLSCSNLAFRCCCKVSRQSCSRARQTPMRKAPAQGGAALPWSQLEEHAAASGVLSSPCRKPLPKLHPSCTWQAPWRKRLAQSALHVSC